MPPAVDVSVIIPCHNHAPYLREAAASALSQVGVDVEVIVVDDGSVDDPASSLLGMISPPIHMVHQAHFGAGYARNTGAAHANGTYLAFLDADDRWASNRLARALEALKATRSPTMAFARMQEFLDPDLAQSEVAAPLVRTLPGISASTLVIQRQVFDHVGVFDSSLKTGEFIDWYLRATRLGVRTHVDDEVLAYRRIHAANRDRWRRSDNHDYARILLRNLRKEQGIG